MPLEYQIPLVSFLFILILNIVYFIKKKVNLLENKTYSVILFCSLIVSLIDTILHIISSNCDEFKLLKFLDFIIFSNKIIIFLFIIIFSNILAYVILISYQKIKKNFKTFSIYLGILDLLVMLVVTVTDIEVVNANTARNVSGSAILIGYVFVGVILFVSLAVNMLNFNKKDKRYWAIFLILLTIVILYGLTILFSGIIIYDLVLAITCYIMYFTIENPDVKMLNEITLAKNELEQANQVKTDFIASMSHEIRTPVNGIVGLAAILLDEKNLNNCREDLQIIIDSSYKLLSMTDKMFDIYELEKEEINDQKTKFNPNIEIEKVMELFKPRISAKNLVLNSEIKITTDIYSNLTILKKVIAQILDNAIKFTDKGFINILVTKVKNNLIIEIEDSGIGIKSEELEKVFIPFHKTVDTKNSAYLGVGVGLSITKSLLDKVNGSIKINSKYHKGTKIIINIPLNEREK